jgi:predicted RNA-binding protein with PUA-like domain
VLFYHSSCPQPGIAGLAKIVSTTYPDPTQFDPKSNYYDSKSSTEDPRWLTLDIQITAKCELIDLKTLREHDALADMLVLRRGNRLSITPVDASHWRYINKKLVKKQS